MLDGIHEMLPREKMSAGVRKRDFYDGKPGAPFVLRIGFYSLDRWIKEGYKSPEERGGL